MASRGAKGVIQVGQVAAAIQQELVLYERHVFDALMNGIEDVAKLAVKVVKQNSPERGGRYRRGWKYTQAKTGISMYQVTVHNRVYQIVHLLEKGHRIKRNAMGAALGKTRAFERVELAQDIASDKLLAIIKKAAQGK